MLSRWNILRGGVQPYQGGPAPAISWPHVRDCLLLLAVEIGIDVGFNYAQDLLPLRTGLLREPRQVLQWFIVATICWLCADPLLRLLNNSRRGLSAPDDSLISMDIQDGGSDEKNP